MNIMGIKHFIVNPNVQHSSQEDIIEVEQKKVAVTAERWNIREEKAKKAFQEECNLKHTFGRIILRVNLEEKNYYTFSNGTKIRRERQFNEFNRRITQPVQGTVISGENIPSGSEILVFHNSFHDTNKIFSYKSKSPDIQYFSIPEYDCYAWRDKGGQMRPMTNFEFGLRIFAPYEGMIIGQPPTQIKDVLFLTTGALKGNVVHTLVSSDYEIIYQNKDGREANLIRIRHSEDPNFDREEVQAISHYLTEKVMEGKLKIGVTPKDAMFHSSHTLNKK